jgi:hypothetical protein
MNTFIKKQLQELVGGDITANGNDRNPTNDSEVEPGPVVQPYNDNAPYVKGRPTTSDKVFGRYRQNIPWFAVYSFGGTRVGGRALNENENKRVITKKQVEEKIEDLVKKSKTSDLTSKDSNPNLEKLIEKIEDMDLNGKQIQLLIQLLSDKEPKNDNKL